MQGGDEGEVELQHNTRLEDIDEPTPSTLNIDMQEGVTGVKRGPSEGVENEIDMQEGVTGVKRGQAECIENKCNDKL